MTKREFDDLYYDKIIHCDTIKKASVFIILAYSFGYSWANCGVDMTFWHNHKEKTFYSFHFNNIKYGNIEYVLYKNKHNIVKFDYENNKGVNLYELNS